MREEVLRDGGVVLPERGFTRGAVLAGAGGEALDTFQPHLEPMRGLHLRGDLHHARELTAERHRAGEEFADGAAELPPLQRGIDRGGQQPKTDERENEREENAFVALRQFTWDGKDHRRRDEIPEEGDEPDQIRTRRALRIRTALCPIFPPAPGFIGEVGFTLVLAAFFSQSEIAARHQTKTDEGKDRADEAQRQPVLGIPGEQMLHALKQAQQSEAGERQGKQDQAPYA